MFQVGPSLSQYGVVCAMRMSGVGLDFFWVKLGVVSSLLNTLSVRFPIKSVCAFIY